MEIIPAFGKPKLDAETEIMFLLSSTSSKVVTWIIAVMVHSSFFAIGGNQNSTVIPQRF